MPAERHVLIHVLITGASSGIGRALALAYAAPGVRLSLFGRDAVRLADVQRLASGKGADAHVVIADITDHDAMAAAILACDAALPVDLLIANAGVSSGTLPDGNPETADAAAQVFRINVQGTANTVLPLLDIMKSRGHGQIALVGSLAGRLPLPNSPAYSASKAAIETWGLALRTAMAPHGLKVSVITPGFVESPMSVRFKGAHPFEVTAERAAAIIRRQLARDRAVIAFPWPLALMTEFARLLPRPLQVLALKLFAFRVEPSL